MGNDKLTGNMNPMEMIMTMSEGNPGAMKVIMDMMSNPRLFLDILLLDSLDIRGSKIWMLYSDCCKKDEGKFKRTLMALRCGAYSEEEIHDNLNLTYAMPFLDDSVQIEGIPSYEEDFGPTDEKWDEYIEANRNIVVPKIKKAAGKDSSSQTL